MTKTFKMHCPKCGISYILAQDQLGTQVRCRGCEADFYAVKPGPDAQHIPFADDVAECAYYTSGENHTQTALGISIAIWLLGGLLALGMESPTISVLCFLGLWLNMGIMAIIRTRLVIRRCFSILLERIACDNRQQHLRAPKPEQPTGG